MRLPIGLAKSFKLHVSSKNQLMEIAILTHCPDYSAEAVTAGRMRLKLTNSWDPRRSKSASSRGGGATRLPKLSDRWMEFQGINNWEGMLDPLDDNLRGEILRYGEFVEAAYRSFEFDTSSPNYAKCKHPKRSMLERSGFGGTGYRVTRNLRATSGIQLPQWIQRAPKWVPTQSGWIGYVAVCTDRKEIARLGRRDVVIAFRGTATCLEWLENLRATLTCLHDHHDVSLETDAPMVESGFLSLYTSQTATCPSLQSSMREEMKKIIQLYGDEPLSVTIVGHSLGAALATLTAYDITTTFGPTISPVTVFSFGGPRVGNRSFRSHLDKSGTKILRIVNSDDLITKVPGFLIDNNDMADSKAVPVRGLPTWLQRHVENTQWAYADVGRELRLSSEPYISKGNIATCHDLKTYLHLVRATPNCILRKMSHDKQLLFR